MRARRESARIVVAVLVAAPGSLAGAVSAAAQTGGVSMPKPVAPTTGGTGYGEPETRAIRVAPNALRNQIVYVRGTLPDASSRAGSAPVAAINVYRRAKATYFGTRLFGRTTACGQVLTPLLHGVAHKTLFRAERRWRSCTTGARWWCRSSIAGRSTAPTRWTSPGDRRRRRVRVRGRDRLHAASDAVKVGHGRARRFRTRATAVAATG
jgi:hypothetical protein